MQRSAAGPAVLAHQLWCAQPFAAAREGADQPSPLYIVHFNFMLGPEPRVAWAVGLPVLAPGWQGTTCHCVVMPAYQASSAQAAAAFAVRRSCAGMPHQWAGQ